jgi:hypothetical protein
MPLGMGWTQTINTLTEDQTAAGWVLLFDGTQAGLETNWVDYVQFDSTNSGLDASWTADEVNGEMISLGQGPHIRSQRPYGDFVVQFDYKTDGNSGFFYRFSLCGNRPAASGIEVAMDINYDSELHSPGDAYDLYSAQVQNFKYYDDADAWNHFALVVIGDSVEHWQNGEFLLGFRYWSEDFQTRYEASKWPSEECFCRPWENETISDTGYIENGYIGIQGDHGGQLHFRNFSILEGPVLGCTDPQDAAYNPDANADDGSCNERFSPPSLDTSTSVRPSNAYIPDVKPANSFLTVEWHEGRPRLVLRSSDGATVLRRSPDGRKYSGFDDANRDY